MKSYLGEWEVRIMAMATSFNKRVFMFKNTSTHTTFLTHEGLQRTFEHGMEKDENEVYFAEMEEEQLQALANAMATAGIKTPNDSKNEGLLEATRYHLEDTRTLLKLNK